ncbi:unnamed protein product (macronuclear) [Paramecium tetraurelia]|uniref:DNA recombination and repair protein Rad51-like C-terminal domain-containing protein n=1 Tax=Paramecium tetraurelia TaxID=5888 RepID=A0DYF0_PARTE|nr:uncharacterized protein GSPATT00003035001 [Paramecium tetraurelia]CAK88067.1 unnamed protein product [Paramecium tetraurelia]|eukprot:XP_001455464.1 hypothetical protein (macronuclear) [Paramecium tetraurelia strain d4-2]
MDQDGFNFQTLESILNRIGASNYQQLALFDKKLFLDTQTSDILYQEKDYLYHLITKKKNLEINQLQKPAQPIPLEFTKFKQLNDYLMPAAWTLEIIGPSLSFKSQILRDMAETMSQKNIPILYISIHEEYSNQKFKVIKMRQPKELFILLSILIESQEQHYNLIIIDGLSSLLYQTAQMNVIENQLQELQQLLALLKEKKGVQIVISSIAKMRENYTSYNSTQDCNIIIQVGRIYKSRQNLLKNYIKQSLRMVETKYDYNENVNKNTLKFQYFCFYDGIIKPEIGILF